MSNVRELLARLNPTTVKYSIGNGGVSELTNQDIAAALAFVKPGLGREVLEACWWPDGAALRAEKLRDAIYAHVRPELERQMTELTEARVHRGMLHACVGWVQNPGSKLRNELAAAEAHLKSIQARNWPVTAWEALPTIVQAVIHEIAKPNKCPACLGRGHVMSGDLLTDCEQCSSHGVLAHSNSSRARAIGKDEAAFRRYWQPMYDWILNALRDAESDAAAQLDVALRDHASVA